MTEYLSFILLIKRVCNKCAEIAQSVEQRIENPCVTSSILVLGIVLEKLGEGVRVVDGLGFENRRGVSYRGFESPPSRF